MSDMLAWVHELNADFNGPVAWVDGGVFFGLMAIAFVGWCVCMRIGGEVDDDRAQ